MKLLEYYLNKALTAYYFHDSSMHSGDEEISKEEVTNFVVFFSIISIIGSILFSLSIATFCWFRYYYKLSLVNNKIIIRARIRNIPDIENQLTDYYDIGDEKYFPEKPSSEDSGNASSQEPLVQDAYSDLEIYNGDFVVVIQDVSNKDSPVAQIPGATEECQLAHINSNFINGSASLSDQTPQNDNNYMGIGDLLTVNSYNQHTNKLIGTIFENRLVFDDSNIMLQEKPLETGKSQPSTKEIPLYAVTLGSTILRSFEVGAKNDLF